METLGAYIDPGTGSMLFTLVVSLLSAGYFLLRRVILKLKFLATGGRGGKASKNKLDYVIFSDHKRYWNVFEPICDEFERRGVDVAFWTASPDDPALERSYKHVTCEFIGEGNKAFARLNMASAWVCLSTTPGLDVYQWHRSKEVDWYVHTFHTVGTAVGYRMFGMDYYDAVLLAGEFQESEIRELERLRGLPAKELCMVGCTYLDSMAKRLQLAATTESGEPTETGELTEDAQVADVSVANGPVAMANGAKADDLQAVEGVAADVEAPNTIREDEHLCVLLAPSWGPNAILSVYGKDIIDALVATGYDVVIRPHPQSRTADKDVLDALMREYPDGEAVEWNFDNDNFNILKRADVMITDFSGVIFDYTLVFDKPVIYTPANYDTALYDAAWLQSPQWRFEVYPSLGIPLDAEQFPHMREVIQQVVASEELAAGRERARREAWEHPGEGALRTVDYLVSAHDRVVAAAEVEVAAAHGKKTKKDDAATARNKKKASRKRRLPFGKRQNGEGASPEKAATNTTTEKASRDMTKDR